MMSTSFPAHKPRSYLVRIIDRDETSRQALSDRLQSSGLMTKSYGSFEEFLTYDAVSEVGCVITDLMQDGHCGLNFQAELQRRRILLPIIFYSSSCAVHKVVKAMQCGALAVVEKSEGHDRLEHEIHRALSLGELEHLNPNEVLEQWDSLTDREREVTQLIYLGLKNREIADRLGGLSTKTIQAHIGECFRKLGVHQRKEVAAWFANLQTMFEPDVLAMN